MHAEDRRTPLRGEDCELVDLLTAVLVDPNLHTDLCMRLHRQVRAILRYARDELHAGSPGEEQIAAADGHDDLPDLLTAVLVDPSLYTDLRMRLHREIRAVLGAASEATLT